MSAILSPDATIADVLATLASSEGYVRGMLENMYKCKREHGTATARIGITGGGVAPNYRIEFENEGLKIGAASFLKIGIEGVFDGRSHRSIEWIDEVAQEKEEVPVRDEHWSNRSMTIDDVKAFLGRIRAAKKGFRRP
jgi:hypothetical protein